MTPCWMRGDEWLTRTMRASGWMSLSITSSSMRSGNRSKMPLRRSQSPQQISTRQSSVLDLGNTAQLISALKILRKHMLQILISFQVFHNIFEVIIEINVLYYLGNYIKRAECSNEVFSSSSLLELRKLVFSILELRTFVFTNKMATSVWHTACAIEICFDK